MWKCAKRSLGATFRRGVLSTEAPNSRDLQKLRQNWPLKLTPTVLEHYNQFYNACKHTYEKYVKGKKDRERPKEKAWFSGVFFHSDFLWSIKCSALLALGYGYVQYKVKVFSFTDLKQELNTLNGYQRSLGYLIDSVGVKPYNCIFPEVKAAKSQTGRQQFASQNFKSDEINFSAFEKAYQKVLGALNNNLGTQCMQSGQHKEAVEYFIQAAEEGHAPGIFNLGICHERGLGTHKDFKRAAELYKRAADLGHATAMYNLGVFYAQGKGGIEVDIDQARALFKAAAKLGQTDAVKALNLDKHNTGEPCESHLVSDSHKEGGNALSHFTYEEFLNPSSLKFFQHLNVCGEDVKSDCESVEYSQTKEISSSSGSDSGVLDLSPESEQYVVLV